MLIRGSWLPFSDGFVRPVMRGEVLAGNGSWVETPFLLDTGADRTVFSANILYGLQLPPVSTSESLGGVGGAVSSVVVETQIAFLRENGVKVLFKGMFAGVTDAHALDMSVLGRDVTNQFAVIVDRPQDAIFLVGQRHRYLIQEQQ